MPATSILVLGAGELGTPILESLASHPRRNDTLITAAMRQLKPSSSDPQRATLLARLESLRISTIPADIVTASEAELSTLFAPYDTVISASGMLAPRGTQLKLAKAVLAAGVKRYVPWQFGLDYDTIGRGKAQDLFDEQLDVRDLLRGQSRTEWIIVSTGIFMTFLFEEAFGVVVGLKGGVEKKNVAVRGLGTWDARVTYTHPVDIGRITADVVLRSWDEERNCVVFTAGDTLSFAELADAVEKAVGTDGEKVQRELWDVEFLTKSLREAPDDGMRKYRSVLADGVGVAWPKESSWNARNGIETKTVQQFAQELRN